MLGIGGTIWKITRTNPFARWLIVMYAIFGWINSCGFTTKFVQHDIGALLTTRCRSQNSWILKRGRRQVNAVTKAVSSILSKFASGHRTSATGHRSCAKDPGHKTLLNYWLERVKNESGGVWRGAGTFPSLCQHQKAGLSMPNSFIPWFLSSLTVMAGKEEVIGNMTEVYRIHRPEFRANWKKSKK